MITGTFYTGSPAIEVEIYCIFRNNAQKRIAIIDTGFTGFAQIPFALAFGMGLVLAAVAPFTLADGSQSTQLLCHGTIEIDGIAVNGLICLSPGGPDVLLGMEWLKETGLELRVTGKGEKAFLVKTS